MRLFFTFFILIIPNLLSAQEGVKIHIIPALHGIHNINKNYSYDSLKLIINRIDPDFIFVEIRPEDMLKDTAYLKKNYPAEMWAMQFWFPKKIILGMDWLGKDIEDKPIPENYWKEKSEIKKLERALDKDSSFYAAMTECETYAAERIPKLKEGTFSEITNGEDEKLTRDYYQCLERNLLHSPYQKITDFYRERNITMTENIARQINSHGKGTYVVVTGADHVPFIKMYLFKNGWGKVIQ